MQSACGADAQVHDIEDLKREGGRQRGCPYYAARSFAEGAELVFCPYSYLARALPPQLAPPCSPLDTRPAPSKTAA